MVSDTARNNSQSFIQLTSVTQFEIESKENTQERETDRYREKQREKKTEK